MMRIAGLVMAMLLAGATVQAQKPSKTGSNSALVGVWQSLDGDGFATVLTINPDGTGEYAGEGMAWRVNGKTIEVRTAAGTVSYPFTVKGKSLTISGGDLTAPRIFTRTATTADSQQTGPGNVATTVVGTWSGPGQVVTFSPDGAMTLNGAAMSWTATGNVLFVQTQGAAVQYLYELNGDTLSITMNGKVVVYQRGSGGAPSKKTGKDTTPGDLRDRIAPELVGKWCWVNVKSSNSGGMSASRCITMRDDGTYDYDSEGSMSATTGSIASSRIDRGTWRFDGTTLFVASQLEGFKTYTLEKRNHPRNGDPMLIIDGESFVTFFQKDPW